MKEENRRPARGRFGIQARVLSLSVLFTLLTAAIILVTSARSLSARLRRDALQSAEYAVQTAAESIYQDIAEIDGLVNWSVTNASVRTSMLTAIPASTLTHTVYPIIANKYNSMHTALYIRRYLILGSNGRAVMLGTASNRSVAVTGGAAMLLPGLGEGEEPVQWERIAEDPLMQPGTTGSGIPITRFMSGGDGTYSAKVYLSVSTALITDALKKFNTEEGAWLCWVMGGELYRVDGDMLTPVGELSQLPAPETGGGGTLDAGTLLYSAAPDGTACNLVLCPLGVHELYLGEVIPNESLVYPFRQLLRPALTSLVLVLFMGLVMAVLLHHIVANPISALQRQIETVSRGDFSVNSAVEWNHELGDVGRGINRLSQSVSDLMARRLEDEKQRLDLEYRMLQNQISPHFIYNTLNSIKWMATIQHAPGVAEMVTALSRLLKSVSKGNQKLVLLRQEFDLLEDYFTIQRYRYGGTITLELPERDGSELQDCLIPRFTLQPLAENAIFHGIEPKGGVGKLVVSAEPSPEGEDLLIRITDDGVGMEQEQIARILTGPKSEADGESLRFRHVGVWNVHRLLQLSFGPEYGLTIRSVLGEGTTVTVRLPRSAAGRPEN